MRRSAAILLSLFAALPVAVAQTPDAPVMGSSASSAVPADEKQLVQILVLGDALGGGLGAGLARIAEPSGNYEVSVRFNEESGLARPEVYDWPATVPKILESNSYGVIVVMLGANDRQTIRAGGARQAFGTPEWAAAYAAQVDALLDALAASGASLIWVGPPPMKDPEYDAAVQAIAAIQRERVEARGISFIDMRPPLLGADGSYADSGEDDTGRFTRLRGRDGISFFKAGNNRMGQIVLDAIESGGKPAAPAAAGAGAAEETARQVPLFGQMLMNGEAYTVQPEGVTANAVMLAGAGLDAAAALKALREIAPPGSAAQGLFARGEAPPAPAGRADDFTVRPQ
jgi:hypothetical protein